MMSHTAVSLVTGPLGDASITCQLIEGDLMLFKQKLGQTNVTSLVERVSRFTVILKNPNKRTKPVMGKIIEAIKDLPYPARRSITFDRGSEFMNWPHLQAETGTQTWFCDPSSPLSAIQVSPAGQCVAKRHRREHQPPSQTLASA